MNPARPVALPLGTMLASVVLLAGCLPPDAAPAVARPTLLSPMFGVCLDGAAPRMEYALNRDKPEDWDDGDLRVDGRRHYLYVGLHPPFPRPKFDPRQLPARGFSKLAGSSVDPDGVLFAARMPTHELAPLDYVFVMVKPEASGTPVSAPAIDDLARHLAFCVRSSWDS